MRWSDIAQSPRDTVLTLALGALGAAVGWLISLPIYLLLGPALSVSFAGLAGVRTVIAPRLRDACFVLVGLAVGAGFTADALGAMIRWPLAFAAMVLLVWVIMLLSRCLLMRGFGFEPRTAVLASAPGHLSFVVSIAADMGADLARVSVTQSIRLLALTLVVPFVALMMGVDLTGNVVPMGTPLDMVSLVVLVLGALVVARIFARFAVPAPLLMGAMVVSGLGHVTGLTLGVMPPILIGAAYVVLGALIGTRFCGVTLASLRRSLGAGVAITAVAVVLSGLAAVPIAVLLGMPVAHVLVAFAPGGLETMIAMGAVLGVIPGFVAACHITRLLALTVLLPLMLARSGRGTEKTIDDQNPA